MCGCWVTVMRVRACMVFGMLARFTAANWLRCRFPSCNAVGFSRAMCAQSMRVFVVQCAEALGAIGSARSLPVLERGAADTCIPCPKAVDASGAGSEAARVERNPLEVRETCAIALDLIRWKVNGRQVRQLLGGLCATDCLQSAHTFAQGWAVTCMRNSVWLLPQGEAPLHCACMSPYTSVDPAPPTATDDLSTLELEKELRDETRSLFDRYVQVSLVLGCWGRNMRTPSTMFDQRRLFSQIAEFVFGRYRAMFSLRNRVPGTPLVASCV